MEFEVVNSGDKTKIRIGPCGVPDWSGCPFPEDWECLWPEDICYRPEPV